ncbi:MAG: hypothetical protein KC486_33060, partial [Myxococcales bacterium]|nr:hypothetical protein [Myxococcales bacterium]
AVAANSGWYTLPEAGDDPNLAMPYGLQGSPIGEAEVARALGQRLTVLLGEADTDTAAEAPTRRRRPSLDELEAEAEALWRAGERAAAERTLRAIIRRAGDSRRADLAYGDLFTITRQLYGREREAAVWREYLARFPRGDYADDARAGLCRRETDADAVRCWGRYLADFPTGLHRAEATRATEAP